MHDFFFNLLVDVVVGREEVGEEGEGGMEGRLSSTFSPSSRTTARTVSVRLLARR